MWSLRQLRWVLFHLVASFHEFLAQRHYQLLLNETTIFIPPIRRVHPLNRKINSIECILLVRILVKWLLHVITVLVISTGLPIRNLNLTNRNMLIARNTWRRRYQTLLVSCRRNLGQFLPPTYHHLILTIITTIVLLILISTFLFRQIYRLFRCFNFLEGSVRFNKHNPLLLWRIRRLLTHLQFLKIIIRVR